MSALSLLSNDQAPIGKRFIATMIDFTLVPPLALLVMLVTGVMETADAYIMPQPIIRIFPLVFVSYFILNGYLLITQGQTLGKRLMKIKIVSKASGELLPFWKILLRSYALLFLACIPFKYNILFVLILIDPLFIFGKSKQCLHDLIVCSKVLNVTSRGE